MTLQPPHRVRRGWRDKCIYCNADPGDPCRTKYGRPYVWLDGKWTTTTRVSTLAKATDDSTNLTKWKQRMTAVGFLRRPDLLTRLAGVIAKAETMDDAKSDINAIVEDAFVTGGGTDAASAGTGFHELSEALDAGYGLEFVPDGDRRRLDAYREALEGYIPLDAERFVVNTELGTGGSYDRRWLCPDGVVRIGDLKTGKWDARYPAGVTTQIAVYATSDWYDITTGEREPVECSQTEGLLIHMPPSGGCKVIPLNLTHGMEQARLAVKVRESRNLKADHFILGGVA